MSVTAKVKVSCLDDDDLAPRGMERIKCIHRNWKECGRERSLMSLVLPAVSLSPPLPPSPASCPLPLEAGIS